MRGDVFSSTCPSRSVLAHVTGKWAVLVLAALQGRDLRFSALRREIDGVSEKMLSQTLRTLEVDGFVVREVAPTSPPQVTYRLSALGRGVTDRLVGLLDWIETSLPSIIDAQEAAAGRA